MSYRDELVEHIKDSGQELIDRAESMVGKDLTEITDFVIVIGFHQGESPTISYTTEVINRRSCNRIMFRKETGSDGRAKIGA